jgi:hypothetical protein
MTSQRWSTRVSVFVLALVLGTAGSARAQWGFPGTWGSSPANQFGLGYGAFPGISPFGYGSFGPGGYVDSSNFIGFPMPGYAQSIGQVPLTTTSFPSLANTVTLIPGWGGGTRGVYRRHLARPGAPRAARPWGSRYADYRKRVDPSTALTALRGLDNGPLNRLMLLLDSGRVAMSGLS